MALRTKAIASVLIGASAAALAVIAPPVQAECKHWQRASEFAVAAWDCKEYDKATTLWEKAAKVARHCPKGETALAISYKRLGECYLHAERYEDAAESFRLAAQEYQDLGLQDSELTADTGNLSTIYRKIYPEDLGQTAAQIIKSAGINYVSIQKLKEGQRIQISFADKMTKEIKGSDVDRIGLDKLVSFDVTRDDENNLRLANIKGLRIRTKFWVHLTDSLIRTSDTGAAPTADITARKMGISKTITCTIPNNAMHKAHSAVMFLKSFRDSFFKTPDHSAIGSSKHDSSDSDSSGTTGTTIDITGTAAEQEASAAQPPPGISPQAPLSSIQSSGAPAGASTVDANTHVEGVLKSDDKAGSSSHSGSATGGTTP